MSIVDFKKIEAKWQKKWDEDQVFVVKRNTKKPKYYALEMFPYPSASGLHMGHALNYSIGDVFVRFKRMHGFNVLYPMGFDALGLPAENAAIKAGEHPKPFTEKAIMNYIRQMKELGLSYDWTKTVETLQPEYYTWNQYFFLKFLEQGLVYRKKASVNWCSACNTVLANEQVHQGKCWRHEDLDVEIRHIDSWFLKTTAYADELLTGLGDLDWPEKIKTMQRHWIGKSHGVEILFEINGKELPIFTTRPDTLYGVTFLVMSSQHEDLHRFVTEDQKKHVEAFLKKMRSVSEKELEHLDKEGVFTGSYAVHPLTKQKVPLYVGNFVVADYGSGVVMAVPAHDKRDFEFAKKYELPITVVIKPEEYDIDSLYKMTEAYTDHGILINSFDFDGLDNGEAKENIVAFLEKKGLAKKVVQYKLRDWGFSRQRYWGTPIPIIHCDSCGAVPVPYEELPVVLPEKITFGEGNPLATNKKWLDVSCPRCKGEAHRETDTMDTFFDSSWYFLRYCDNHNEQQPFSEKEVSYWMPVDKYIGGAEHACMHLIYARFFTKALRDLGFLSFDEPFTSLFNQGTLHGPDGEKMSKSRGNVINPDEVSVKYGMDTGRFFLLSLASPDKSRDWSEEGINGSLKFIKKVFSYFGTVSLGKSDAKLESILHKTIKDVTSLIESFKYNLAIIKIRELFQSLSQSVSKKDLEVFLKLLHPFCPHVTEELWEQLGNKPYLSLQSWPVANEAKINEAFEKEAVLLEALSDDLVNLVRLMKERGAEKRKGYVYVLPQFLKQYVEGKDVLEKKTGLSLEVFAVNDPKKYDPEHKAKKAKPNKPALYLE